MCVSPSYVYDNTGPELVRRPVSCRKCWQCRQNRVNDYVGRALAEASHSDWTLTLTLTYAPIERGDSEYLCDKVLTKRHFQHFMKRLRMRWHGVSTLRYMVAGETGDLKGRTHFHLILFGRSVVPGADSRPYYNPSKAWKPTYIDGKKDLRDQDVRWPQETRFHIEEWLYGHVFCDWNADHDALHYVCKYLLKDQSKRDSWFSTSKKPAIGRAFFDAKAERDISLGVWPSTFNYRPPNAKGSASYSMSGATRRDYLLKLADAAGVRLWQRFDRIAEPIFEALHKALKWRWLRDVPTLSMDEFTEIMLEKLAPDRIPDHVAERLVKRDRMMMNPESDRDDTALNAWRLLVRNRISGKTYEWLTGKPYDWSGMERFVGRALPEYHDPAHPNFCGVNDLLTAPVHDSPPQGTANVERPKATQEKGSGGSPPQTRFDSLGRPIRPNWQFQPSRLLYSSFRSREHLRSLVSPPRNRSAAENAELLAECPF